MKTHQGSTGYDKSQAIRAWLIAERLRTQTARLGLQDSIRLVFPENAADLEALESEIQDTARALSEFTGVMASSLEILIGEIEQIGFIERRRQMRRWQY